MIDLNKAGVVGGIVGSALLASMASPLGPKVAGFFGLPQADQDSIDRSRKIALVAGASSVASSFAFKGKTEHVRMGVFFGGGLVANTLSDIDKGRDVTSSVVQNTIAGAAGLLAYVGTKRNQGKFISLLLNGKTTGRFVSGIEASYAKVIAKQPLLGKIMLDELAPTLVAAGAVPFAHTLTLRATIKGSKIVKQAQGLVANQGTDNSAGDTEGRREMGGSYAQQDPNVTHTGVNMRTHVIER